MFIYSHGWLVTPILNEREIFHDKLHEKLVETNKGK